jgi:hypothetical protein
MWKNPRAMVGTIELRLGYSGSLPPPHFPTPSRPFAISIHYFFFCPPHKVVYETFFLPLQRCSSSRFFPVNIHRAWSFEKATEWPEPTNVAFTPGGRETEFFLGISSMIQPDDRCSGFFVGGL